jgi:transposase
MLVSTQLHHGHMDTSSIVEPPGRRTHRRHSADFKARVVGACRQAGVSIASVALANGLNANLLRRWVVETERVGTMAAHREDASAADVAIAACQLPAFVAVQMPAPPIAVSLPDIHIELSRGQTKIVMRWPASQASACATWLREMLR